MIRVWIVNDSGHDFSAARKYGTLVRFTEDRVDIFHVDRLAKHITRGVVLSKPEDMVLLSGAPIINAIVVRQWIRHHGKINILQWNAITREYEKSELHAKHLDVLLEQELIRR